MKVTTFGPDGTRQVDAADLPGLLASQDSATTVWVDISGPTDEDLRVLREVFGFHPLAIEDTTNDIQRPKVDEYPGYLFVLLNAVGLDDDGVVFREIDLFIGRNYVVTVHDDGEPCIAQAEARLPLAEGKPGISAGFLLYVLLDVTIDGYFPVLDGIDEAIDDLENRVLAAPNRNALNDMFHLKRMLVRMGRVVWPQREIVTLLLHPDLPFEARETLRYYLHDVQDHLLWIADAVSTYRDTLTSITDLYMSAVSNRLNMVVNRLAIITVIMGVLTGIGGFYGMNFAATWPPFGAAWGVPFVVAVMLVLTGGLLLLFRRLGWY